LGKGKSHQWNAEAFKLRQVQRDSRYNCAWACWGILASGFVEIAFL